MLYLSWLAKIWRIWALVWYTWIFFWLMNSSPSSLMGYCSFFKSFFSIIIRGDHGSVRVGFVPNPRHPTKSGSKFSDLSSTTQKIGSDCTVLVKKWSGLDRGWLFGKRRESDQENMKNNIIRRENFEKQ